VGNTTLARRLLGSPAVSEFLDGVMLYVLSKEWYDTFATHLLQLHPLPYCSEDDSELPCTLEASAASQLSFAVVMLLGATVLVRLTECFGQSACAEGGGSGSSLSIVPPMAGMCVGWAFGFAAVKWLTELDGSIGVFQAHPGLANLALSAAATLGAAVLIVVCRPSTLGLACGVTPLGLPTTARRAARVVLGELEGVWRLSARAVSVVVMMLWTKGLSLMLVEGTEPAQRQGPMYVRMLLFWAVSLTMGGSLASLSIIRQRAGCIDELRAGSSSLALITPTPLPPRELLWQRINSTAVRAHALALLEQTVGWAVGCAWTNLVLASTSLASFPTLKVTSWDLLVALSLTLLAICWFFFTRPPAGAMNSFFPRRSYGERDAAGETKMSTSTPRGLTANRVSYHAPTPTKALTGPSSGEVERAQVELFYLTNAFSFFVGWAWVSFLRDLQTLIARIASSSDLLSGGAAWSYLSEALCATTFGPGLTWLLVRSRQCLGGRHVWQALLAKVEEIEEVYAVQSTRAAEPMARCEMPTAVDTATQPEPPRDNSLRVELPTLLDARVSALSW